MNIWSHVFGSLLFLSLGLFLYTYIIVGPRYTTASESDVLVFSCFFAGAVSCLGMSATFHAVTNHSEEVHKWGNKLDYTGIVLLIVGSFVPALYYPLFCHTELMAVYLSGVSRD